MFPASRRIFLYGLLLLVPTLAVGTGAILLLRREQAQLAARTALTEDARRAAAESRTGLVVESAELLAGDIQTALLDTLEAVPAGGLESFLDRWKPINPLVHTTFIGTLDGRLLRPSATATDEESQGFVRRFTRQFGSRPPWGLPNSANAPVVAPETKELKDESPIRQKVETNLASSNSARYDVQQQARRDLAEAVGVSPAAEADAVGKTGSVRTSFGPGAASSEYRAESADKKEKSAAAPAVVLTKSQAGGRRGWAPTVMEGHLHLLGWVQPGGAAEVRGVELDLAVLAARLAGALPVEIGADEGYALRDDQGRVLQQVGAVARGAEPLIRVPLATALLPGWEVAGYLAPVPAGSGGGAILLMGSFLVGFAVLAILAAGSALLWQARQSGVEAAQKTSFVANVSHEFKTPLTSIRLYAELLEQGRMRDAAQGKEYLQTIGRETQRLARLVNNVLDFSRLEQGRKKFARETLDLGAELARLLETQLPRLAEAGLMLQRRLPAVPLPLDTDRDAVEQIVLNLLDNACKYAAAGGEVTVSLAARSGGGAELRVADRGPGVSADQRERIFEKFHRVDSTLTAEKGGAGLGLSIARQLARGLGGDLRCEGGPEGGAAFLLELP